MSTAVKAYVGAVLALAAGAIVFASQFGAPVSEQLPSLIGFAVAMLLVQLLPVPFPRGNQLELVRVEEAVVVPLVLLLDPLPALLAVAIGVFTGHLIARADLMKAAFNTAQLVLAVSAALAVTALISGSTSPGYGTLELAAATAGLLAMFVVNQLLVAGVLRVAARTPIHEVLFDDLSLKVGMWVANACLGALLVLPASQAPGLLLLALVPLVMLHAAWRVHADRAKDEQRLRELGVAVGGMSGGVISMEHVARQLAHAAREVVEADGAQVRLFEADRIWWSRRVNGETTAGEQARADAKSRPEDDAGRVSYTVPLTGGQGPLGELDVWVARDPDVTQRAFGRRDRTLLEMLVAQATTSLDNAVLASQSEQQRRTITQVFEHSSEGMLVLDRRGRVRGWNPAMQAMSGFAQGTVDASPISLISHQLGTIIGAERAGTIDADISTADGARRSVRASFAPIEAKLDGGSDDEPTWVVVLRDVTAEHETERLKDDFVATVSHELRTPLTAIKGFLETMRRDDIELGAGQVRMFLQIMGEQADRLERLIGDLLDMSAIESGRPLEVDLTPVDLGTSVRRAITTFEAARPTAEVSLTDIEVGLVVDADAHRLEQVLTNLLDNAIKHSGGAVHVDVEIARDELGHATIAVTDHGPGISVVDQRRIFERFFVTADSITRSGGGAGLGLYICNKIIDAMHGNIRVGSKIGSGTTFTVTLPVLAASLPRPSRGELPAPLHDPHSATQQP